MADSSHAPRLSSWSRSEISTSAESATSSVTSRHLAFPFKQYTSPDVPVTSVTPPAVVSTSHNPPAVPNTGHTVPAAVPFVHVTPPAAEPSSSETPRLAQLTGLLLNAQPTTTSSSRHRRSSVPGKADTATLQPPISRDVSGQDDGRRRASTGDGAKEKSRLQWRRQSTPAPVPEHDQPGVGLEFVARHQQDKLAYGKLKGRLDDFKPAYAGSVCTGLLLGSLLAVLLRLGVIVVGALLAVAS